MAGGEAAAGGEVIPPPRSTLPVRVSVVGLPRAFPHADTTSAFGGSYLGQLALLSQLADLAHDRRLMPADLSETEQRVADLVTARRVSPGVLDAPPGAEAAALPLTEVNIMVRIAPVHGSVDRNGQSSRDQRPLPPTSFAM